MLKIKRRRAPLPEEILVIDEKNIEINIREIKSFIICKDKQHNYNPEIELFPLQINYKNGEILTIDFESFQERLDICSEFIRYDIFYSYE